MPTRDTSINRRRFLSAAGATIAGAGLLGLRGSLTRAAEPASSARTRALRVGHLTDVHVQPERNATTGMAAALRHVQSQADPPQLLLTGGDSIMDALAVSRERAQQQWKLWKQVLKDESSLGVESCIGNHDVWGWNRADSHTTGDEPQWGKRWALDEFGIPERYRSFDKAGWHFVILDSIHPDQEMVYQGRLDDQQFDWLAADLAATDQQTPVLVLSHIPILTVAGIEFHDSLAEDPRRSRMLSHQDAKRIVDLFKQHANVKLCLSGHLHLAERIEYAGVTYACSGAVSGNWWKGQHHGTEEGYALVDLYNDGTFDWQYVDYGWKVEA
jgi:3',5'-cyclic AMP phosphodiesterase CpdA